MTPVPDSATTQGSVSDPQKWQVPAVTGIGTLMSVLGILSARPIGFLVAAGVSGALR